VRLKPYQEIETKSLKGCLVAVTPAMLVVLSWMYVALANVNMVRLDAPEPPLRTNPYLLLLCSVDRTGSQRHRCSWWMFPRARAGVFQLRKARGPVVPGR
jgi:hypothetical protein